MPSLNIAQPKLAGGQASLAVDDARLLNPPIRPNFGQEKAAPEAVTEDVSFMGPGMQQFLNDVSKRSGLDIRISNEMGPAKGLLQGKTVYLNEELFEGNPEYAVTSILTHELTHAMEGTPEYNRLADMAVEAMSADYGGMDFAGLVDRKVQEYAAGGVTLDAAGAQKEIVAEFMEQAMSDPATAQRLLTQEPGVFERMLQWIKDALETIINSVSLRKDKVAQAQYKCYRKAQQVFVEALNNNLAGRGQGQFAIDYVPVKTEDGQKVVPLVYSEADLYEFGFDENLSQEDNFYQMRGGVKGHLKSRLAGKTLTGADQRKMVTEYPTERYDLADELTYGRQFKEEKTVRNRGLSYLDMALNIEEVSMTLKTMPKTEPSTRHPEMAAKGFDAPMFLFMDGNGETFICKAKVATNKDGINTLYAIPSMKRFNINSDTLTKERESALNVSGIHIETEKKSPQFPEK
ncbi:hypothetical protein ACKQTC_02605 [Peptococcus simiae]|uniref:Uncharacterized protein n=1 Tax=Peptococcus simiae TaxID=1643805 RepID=A0ABW9GXG2_9FIRM